MESEEDDSLLLDFCDEIEKTVQKDSSRIGASASTISEKKSVDASSSIRALGGFSTASGTQIPLSENALKAGESLLGMFLAEAVEEIPDEYD
jgi:BRCA2 repeat